MFFFYVSDRGKIFEFFFQFRIHSVLIYIVDRDDIGIINELILLNYFMFYSV